MSYINNVVVVLSISGIIMFLLGHIEGKGRQSTFGVAFILLCLTLVAVDFILGPLYDKQTLSGFLVACGSVWIPILLSGLCFFLGNKTGRKKRMSEG